MDKILKSPTYFLPTGILDQERLAILDEVYGEYTRALFDRMDIQKGQKVAIFGCGTGEGLDYVHKKIGNEGKLLCIDISAEQIKITKDALSGKGISNVEYRIADIQDVKGDETYDVAYCRFVLIHVQNPQRSIGNMLSFIKPGGLIACEEHSTEWRYSYPKLEAFKKMMELQSRWEKAFNKDSKYGGKLYHEMLNFPVKPLYFESKVPIFNSFRKKQLSILSWEAMMRNEEIKKIVPEEEIKSVVTELKRYQHDESFFQSAGVLFQYLGMKL